MQKIDDALRDRILAYAGKLNRDEQRKVPCPNCASGERANKSDPSLSIKNCGDHALYNCHYCEPEFSGRINFNDRSDQSYAVRETRAAARSTPETDLLGVKWLESRGLVWDKVKQFVLLKEQYFAQAKVVMPAVEFVYRDTSGQRVYSKFRSFPDKHYTSGPSKPGGTDSLFLIESVDFDKNYLILTEGELDALSLRQCDANAVSMPTGANIKWLAPNQKLFARFKRVLVWFDADAKGSTVADKLKSADIRLTRNFEYLDIGKFKALHPECKDANDVLMSSPPQPAPAFQTIIDTCFSKPKHGFIIRPDDLIKSIHRVRDGSYAERIGIGESDIDNIYSPTRGYMTLVTGIPGHGKTTWLNWYAYRLAHRYGWKIGLWSPETDPVLHSADFIGLVAGRSVQAGAGQNPMSDPEIMSQLKFVSEHFLMIQDEEDAKTDIGTILNQCLTLKLTDGADGFILDPWNYIELPNLHNNTDAIKFVLGRIRKFAAEHNVHMWVVAHPSKMQQKVAPRKAKEDDDNQYVESEHDAGRAKYKVPAGYDVSGAAHFYNMTDVGLTVYRDDPETKIIVWKVRRPFLGAIGDCRMQFQAGSGRFINPWARTPREVYYPPENEAPF